MVPEDLFSLAIGLVPPWLVDHVTFTVEEGRRIKKRIAALGPGVILVQTICAHAAIPLPARSVGYTDMTFSSKFKSSDMDLGAVSSRVYQWYLWSFFGKTAGNSELSFNKNGTLTLKGGRTGPNGEIATAARASGDGKFVGTAFGGGAYFEATLAFRPTDVIKARYRGWPSFWSMAVEHLVGYGQHHGLIPAKSFQHFIEVDIFEYDLLRYMHVENVYGGALHDWYSKRDLTGKNGLCGITNSSIKKWVPRGTNFDQFHTYGLLWKPATRKSDGYVRFYFDGRPVGDIVKWHHCALKYHPGDKKYSLFSILDHQHLVLILGTGIGEPMTVKSVRVFQMSSRDNIVE